LRERRIDAGEDSTTTADLERGRIAGRAAERLGRMSALDAARLPQIRESHNTPCDGGNQKRII
jgi:hypothetical protein